MNRKLVFILFVVIVGIWCIAYISYSQKLEGSMDSYASEFCVDEGFDDGEFKQEDLQNQEVVCYNDKGEINKFKAKYVIPQDKLRQYSISTRTKLICVPILGISVLIWAILLSSGWFYGENK